MQNDLDCTTDAWSEDIVPERALALRALASIGVPETALEAARRVDVVSGGLTPVQWAVIALRAAQGAGVVGVWGWSALTVG